MMKIKIFLFAAVVFCFSNKTFSQINRDIWLISASTNMGFYSDYVKTEYQEYKIRSFEIYPKFGYFLFNNFLIGTELGFRHRKTYENYNFKSTSISGGPLARIYIPGLAVKPFFEAQSLFGIINETDSDNTSVFDYGGGVGMAIPIAENITFDILAGYKSQIRNKDNSERTQNTFYLQFGFGMFFGYDKY